jgi:hypothetical protein
MRVREDLSHLVENHLIAAAGDLAQDPDRLIGMQLTQSWQTA